MGFDVANRLKALRHAAGLSQRALAARASVANATISQIESGHMSPTIAMLERIVGGLDISLIDLLAGNGTEVSGHAVAALPLTHAIEHLSEGFALFDSEDRLVLCNGRYQDFYDYKTSDLRPGITITDLLNLDISRGTVSEEAGGIEATHNRIRRFRAAQDTFEVPLADGRWLQIRDRRTPEGGTVSLHADITERKRAYEKTLEARDAAEAATQAKSEFIAVVSHEVRTPMNGVLGMARLLKDMDVDAEQRECVDTIIASGEALLTIIDDLLDISKMDAGRLELESIPFHLPDVIADCASLMKPRADENGLALTTAVDPSIPPVLVGDPLRLRQVLLNLLSNAVKFTDEGSVRIAAEALSRTAGGAVLAFDVIDTGRGIAPDAQEKLFSVYTQASVEVARKYGGTGLGLAICRRLVEMMGGEITLESALDQGAAFRVTVPLAVGDTADLARLRKEEGSAPAVPGKRQLFVLQVEDNETNRQVTERILTRAGHRVVSVVNGVEALAALEAETFDAIVMDRHMPEMDGIEATRRIRAMAPPLATLPIVGVTAGAIQVELDACSEAGMDEVLTKPLEAKELLAALKRLAADRRKSPPAGGGLPVLVVDDAATNRAVAIKQLESLGVPCDLADSGGQALARAAKTAYRAVLADVSMPGMDGVEMTRRLRKMEVPSGRRTPVIAVTGHVEAADRERFLAAGMDDVLVKPLKPDTLAAVLERWSGAVAGLGAPRQPIDLDRLSEILGTGERDILFSMLGVFVDDIPNLVPPLQDALAARDALALRDAAHKASGTAKNAAAPHLADLLAGIEADSGSGDWDSLGVRVTAAVEEFARAERFCRREGGED